MIPSARIFPDQRHVDTEERRPRKSGYKPKPPSIFIEKLRYFADLYLSADDIDVDGPYAIRCIESISILCFKSPNTLALHHASPREPPTPRSISMARTYVGATEERLPEENGACP